MSAAGRKRTSAAMGKVEGKVCSPVGHKPSSNECRWQEDVVCVDEGALGREAKVESIIENLSAIVGRLVYSRIFSLDLEPFEIQSLMLGNDPPLVGSVARE